MTSLGHSVLAPPVLALPPPLDARTLMVGLARTPRRRLDAAPVSLIVAPLRVAALVVRSVRRFVARPRAFRRSRVARAERCVSRAGPERPRRLADGGGS